MVRTGPTNSYLKQLIVTLRQKSLELKAPIWKAVARKLEKPRRQRVQVNLDKISKYSQDGGAIVVPGVVLGDGQLTKKVSIAAWKFSSNATAKIKKVKCKPITIQELMEMNPKGTGVKIIS